jgi:hypothetical protein
VRWPGPRKHENTKVHEEFFGKKNPSCVFEPFEVSWCRYVSGLLPNDLPGPRRHEDTKVHEDFFRKRSFVRPRALRVFVLPAGLGYDFGRFQRASAALRAICRRRAALRLIARARPPLSPPSRPSAAACGFFSGTPVSAAESRGSVVCLPGVALAGFVPTCARVRALCLVSRRSFDIRPARMHERCSVRSFQRWCASNDARVRF